MKSFSIKLLLVAVLTGLIWSYTAPCQASQRRTINFDLDWNLIMGNHEAHHFASAQQFNPMEWGKIVSLPHAFNEKEAFLKPCAELTDTIVWYVKVFSLSKKEVRGKTFIEFEGARQAADVYVNGTLVGYHENGVMAFGFDLSQYVKPGKNIIAVRVDNSWTYRERGHKYSRYQWNDKNFNANYGGLPKHVRLHLTGRVYQTLPLYSNLATTGTYVYATHMDVAHKTATIHVESQVRNESDKPATLTLHTLITGPDGKRLAITPALTSSPRTLMPGDTCTLKAAFHARDVHFWSWGYGYLYDVKTSLIDHGEVIDEVTTRTGFRKTEFAQGKVKLNDRVMMMKGFAQRTSNEWPGLGMSVPAWLSDYSNALMVEAGANLVRWMHVTPWKQDVESCDRVGLIQAMPAGDSEKDVTGRRWEQRVMLMRDAIIYNRNNPSILFYECGNESVSREHLLEMKALRDAFDPHGGRAVGSREMLDINEAEYGGEMLYINKSAKHPMWAMEYCRDEGMRRYQDNWSWPYHKHGDGPLYKNADASAYNQNQDMLAIEHIRRWYDYWLERPGTGKRTSAGGTKIIFSDSNTHSRGESNYRTSGVVDAMRTPKESFYTHRVMWNGWVEPEQEGTHIIGHWNYAPGVVKPVYVVSTAACVDLYLNGKKLGRCHRDYTYLHTLDSVAFAPGTLVARGYNTNGEMITSDTLVTTGRACTLKLTTLTAPDGLKADGADVILVQVDAVDEHGRCCPNYHEKVTFQVEGPIEYLGGIAGNRPDDAPGTPKNYIGSYTLPLECGTNRILLRSTRQAGKISITATSNDGMVQKTALKSTAVANKDGKCTYRAASHTTPLYTRGATPSTPSYIDTKESIEIAHVEAGCNNGQAGRSCDDNELSEWTNNGILSKGWITYTFQQPAVVDEVCMKLTGWRMRSYPLEIYADSVLVWSGNTPKSLGYVHLPLKPVKSSRLCIKLKGAVQEKEEFGQIVELAAPVAGELDLYKSKKGKDTGNELRIVEIDLLHHLVPHAPDGTPLKTNKNL